MENVFSVLIMIIQVKVHLFSLKTCNVTWGADELYTKVEDKFICIVFHLSYYFLYYEFMTEVIKYMDVRWSLGSGISFRGSLTKTNIKMLYIKRVHIAVAKMYSLGFFFYVCAWLFNYL